MLNKLSLNDHLLTHCNESMEKALAAECYPVWQRSSPQMNDIDFIRLGLLHCISAVDSGRHFIQTTEEVHGELLPHSSYFKSLKSSRCTHMLEAIEHQSYKIHCDHLASLGIDYLKSFPELDEYTVEAADGHFIDHACHTPRGDNGKVYAAGFIYGAIVKSGV